MLRKIDCSKRGHGELGGFQILTCVTSVDN